MINPEAVAAINAIAFFLFTVSLVIGAVSTFARVLFYRMRGVKRPRLLTRDVIVYGGLALAFGQIAFVRFLGPAVQEALRGNVLWSLSTAIPACVAVLVYVYFELFVIERARRGDEPALESSVQENIALTKAVAEKVDAAVPE